MKKLYLYIMEYYSHKDKIMKFSGKWMNWDRLFIMKQPDLKGKHICSLSSQAPNSKYSDVSTYIAISAVTRNVKVNHFQSEKMRYQ